MIANCRRWLLAGLVVLCAVAPAGAGVIEYSAVFDTVTQSHFELLQGPVFNTMRLESSVGHPTLTADFQADKQLRVTYSAPAGQHFVFTPPADADDVSLTVWLGTLSAIAFGNDAQEPGISIVFEGLEGTAPSETSFRMVYGGMAFPGPDDDFAAIYHADLGGPFSFQSVTALFDVPAGYDNVFNALSPVVTLAASATWNSDHDDPGPWLSIEPLEVPEPSSALLLLLAVGRLAIGRMRKAV